MEPDELLAQRLDQLSNCASEPTIFRVHNYLRNVRPKTYDPDVIAIGPYHLDKNLKMMEEQKLVYLNSLLESKNDTLQRYVSALEPLEQKARECYAEDICMSPTKFVSMLVLDGCFIIQLVRKYNDVNLRTMGDPIFQMDWIRYNLRRDLVLFENQIPFFILLKLFELVDDPCDPTRLMTLLHNFLHYMYPGEGYRNNNNRNHHEIKHLLDFVHGNWSLGPSDQRLLIDHKNSKVTVKHIDNVRELKEANVDFLRSDNKDSVFNVRFQEGKMTLQPLTVDDFTESFLRNLIAYEQYFPGSVSGLVTCYAKLLDCLIDNSKDVEILCGARIIDNWLGDYEVVADMINKLMDGVLTDSDRFIYTDLFDQVNTHRNKRKNRYWATLRHNYLNSPWAILSIVAGFIILVLTFIETVCAIMQVSKKVGK